MVLFRVDCNQSIASGHVMRCISIAKMLEHFGVEVRFVSADSQGRELISNAGFDQIVLDTKWDDLSCEITQMQELLHSCHQPLLLIDTYSVTKQYIDSLSAYARLAYLGSKQEYLGDIRLLINYSSEIDYEFYKQYKNTELLLGPQYIPLRREFSENAIRISPRVKRLLITTGNTETEGLVSGLIDNLKPLAVELDFVIDVVVGRMFKMADQLKEKYDKDENVCLHFNVSDMVSVMKTTDMTIATVGTTVYELMALHIPCLGFAMVEEQKKSGESLSNHNVIEYLGTSYSDREAFYERAKHQVKKYIADVRLRENLANVASGFVDGKGCERIAKAIMKELG